MALFTIPPPTLTSSGYVPGSAEDRVVLVYARYGIVPAPATVAAWAVKVRSVGIWPLDNAIASGGARLVVGARSLGSIAGLAVPAVAPPLVKNIVIIPKPAVFLSNPIPLPTIGRSVPPTILASQKAATGVTPGAAEAAVIATYARFGIVPSAATVITWAVDFRTNGTTANLEAALLAAGKVPVSVGANPVTVKEKENEALGVGVITVGGLLALAFL